MEPYSISPAENAQAERCQCYFLYLLLAIFSSVLSYAMMSYKICDRLQWFWAVFENLDHVLTTHLTF
ncbi:MAG: hypothetical protein ACREAL_05760, partial [Nitrosopumilaceae archaeon]